MQPSMYYAELRPRCELQPYVAAYWHFRVAASAGEIEHSVPLGGGLLLAFSAARDDVLLFGPRTAPLRPRVRGGDAFWGVHFWPGAAPALLGPRVRGLRDQGVPAAARLDPHWVAALGQGLREAVNEGEAAGCLDRLLCELLPGARALDGAAMSAVFEILRSGGRAPVGRLAHAALLSPRQFRRRFLTAVELSPKELARLRRVRASVEGLTQEPDEPWTTVAAAGGYADQAHLSREFKRLTGLTPVAFGRHTRRIAHGELVKTPER